MPIVVAQILAESPQGLKPHFEIRPPSRPAGRWPGWRPVTRRRRRKAQARGQRFALDFMPLCALTTSLAPGLSLLLPPGPAQQQQGRDQAAGSGEGHPVGRCSLVARPLDQIRRDHRRHSAEHRRGKTEGERKTGNPHLDRHDFGQRSHHRAVVDAEEERKTEAAPAACRSKSGAAGEPSRAQDKW